MIKIIIKILIALIVGYFSGFLIGRTLGGLAGTIVSPFFKEIVYFKYTVIMSIIIAIIVGGIIGYTGTEVVKKIFETTDNSFLGIIFGAAIGFIVLLYNGALYIPNPSVYDHSFYLIPVFYCAPIGQYIGSIFFPLIGIRGIIHEETETRKRIKFNNEIKNELSFYKSKKQEENK